ncbi:MAG: BolA family transcriptional regulator [Leptospiraceae bacterium]|nr:BolA family transcriptional regulator [Leptospiraceae bacterium]MCP5498673.1 BolA family transcriptional regulator [Leptospiraceae bacterium]
MKKDEIEEVLRETFKPDILSIVDYSEEHSGHAGNPEGSGGTHFRIRLYTPLFKGKSLLEQHRLVYNCLQEFFQTGLHALHLETGFLEEK